MILDKKTGNAVRKEIEAQIKKYIAYGFTLGHIDSHQPAHTNPSVFGLLLPIAKEFYTVTPNNDRAMPSEELAALIRTFGATATPFSSVADAIETAARGEDPSLAVGSLYMAGEVHEAFRTLMKMGKFEE